jgi:hypothetical protein
MKYLLFIQMFYCKKKKSESIKAISKEERKVGSFTHRLDDGEVDGSGTAGAGFGVAGARILFQ